MINNLDAELSHVLDGARERVVGRLHHLDLGANTRLVEWSHEAVLLTKLFDRHRRLRSDHRVDATH